MEPANRLARVRSRVAAMMAPLENPMAMGCVMVVWLIMVASMKSASIGTWRSVSVFPVIRHIDARLSDADSARIGHHRL